MKLRNSALLDPAPWRRANIALPEFDRAAMINATRAAPSWIHFGAGNIFRAFPAALQQTLLERGLTTTGIVAVAGSDGETINRVFRPYDNLTLLVTLKADGAIEKRVIASIADALRMDKAEDVSALKAMFRAPSLQMVSFTVTEKGYIVHADGKLTGSAAADIDSGPEGAKSYLGRIAALCYERFRAGSLPAAFVSMDNCSHNGDRLFEAFDAFAKGWEERGFAAQGFRDYISDHNKVSFPWSMIDKITPRPDESVKALLEQDGFTDTAISVNEKQTYTAAFVNAEETQYLVIEDSFPAGRPPLEKAGVLFTSRETVDKVEKMKVCTCLNPLHTALAIFGCLLGYVKISDEMKDPDLLALVELIGCDEGLPVVVDPGIISPRKFIDQVLKQRLPNPYMPDTPQRIASDTSLKIPIRFGETLKAYLRGGALSTAGLKGIPLVIAAWFRYLLGIDDEGKAFTVSPDPQYASLRERLGALQLGQKGPFTGVLRPLLSDASLFAVSLYDAGIGGKVEAYFTALMAGNGAARSVLHEVVSSRNKD